MVNKTFITVNFMGFPGGFHSELSVHRYNYNLTPACSDTILYFTDLS